MHSKTQPLPSRRVVSRRTPGRKQTIAHSLGCMLTHGGTVNPWSGSAKTSREECRVFDIYSEVQMRREGSCL